MYTNSTKSTSLFSRFLNLSTADSLSCVKFANFMDKNELGVSLRSDFLFPKMKDIAKEVSEDVLDGDADCIYLCGNSLGLQSKQSRSMVLKGLNSWTKFGVEGWFQSDPGELPWTRMEDLQDPTTNNGRNIMADLVGASSIEISMSSSLTQHLNALLLTFYKPTPTRHKILIEEKAFPSDRYAVEAQIRHNGYNSNKSLVIVKPRNGEYCLRIEDILQVIQNEGDTIAVVMLPGVQYYTGQLFDIKTITSAAQAKGCIVGWDLAHAVGNVPLELHSWNVDFAVWCSYKYLNGGPGAIGGLFLHKRHAYTKQNETAGWWALDVDDRFKMDDVYRPRVGAAGFHQSTVNILSLSSVIGSLEVFAKTSMEALRTKSILLTAYLDALLRTEIPTNEIVIMTPSAIHERGAQISILIQSDRLTSVHEGLRNHGIVVDKRNPNCLRIAPVPLYSTFEDVRYFVITLKKLMKSTN